MPAFEVSQSIDINADANHVFDYLRDYAKWSEWSPWLLADPDCEMTFKGETDQVGGGYSWDSDIVGSGQMEHTEIVPPSEGKQGLLRADLKFLKPWKSESDVEFVVRSTSDSEGMVGTIVTWKMKGALPFFLFWMKRLMVSMIGMDYDRGLKMLKSQIETGKVDSALNVHGVQQIEGRRVIGRSTSVRLQEISAAMEKDITEINRKLKTAGVDAEGTWLAAYSKLNLKTQTLTYFVGMELDESIAAPDGLQAQVIEPLQCMHVRHTGSYTHLGNAWFTAHQRIRSDGHKAAYRKPSLEIYRNNPETTPPEELITDVYVPVK
ncbi:SRPBCC family protein [Stieleria sp. JC731]|uniref:SRPBCC family protein n=1 Tax=Pirellulaceae TaxID=2691357 RepID=UPI001E2D9ED6|nr:GyrI-like domain-containing protein [Stieleria sp. JC731]MCC9602707.1 SRPBCC family protein [Stieleria sp. JC731]